jgi:hypothetical protein
MEPTVKTNSFERDVMCIALEGGIGYWAVVRNVKRTEGSDWEYLSFEARDMEDKDAPWCVVDAEAIRRGVRLVLGPGFTLCGEFLSQVAKANSEQDAGYLDAYGADVIVQAACFGEVVFS